MLAVLKVPGLFGMYWYVDIVDQVYGCLCLRYLAILWLILWLSIWAYIMYTLCYKFNGLVIFSSIFLVEYSCYKLMYPHTLMENAFLAHKFLLIHIWLTINLVLIRLAQSGEIRRQVELQIKLMFSWFLFFIGGSWWLAAFLGESFWWKTTDSVEFLLLVLFIYFFYIYHVRESYNESYRRYIGFFIGLTLCILCYKEVDPNSPFHSSFKFYVGGGFSYLLWLYFILNLFILDVDWLYGYMQFKFLRYRYLYILALLHLSIYWVLGVIVWVGFWFYLTLVFLALVYRQVYLDTVDAYSSFVIYNFFNLSFVLAITLVLLIGCLHYSIITLHYIILYMVSFNILCVKVCKMQFGYLGWVYYFFFMGVVLFQLLNNGIRQNHALK